jgi:hypothetical protein
VMMTPWHCSMKRLRMSATLLEIFVQGTKRSFKALVE